MLHDSNPVCVTECIWYYGFRVRETHRCGLSHVPGDVNHLLQLTLSFGGTLSPDLIIHPYSGMESFRVTLTLQLS